MSEGAWSVRKPLAKIAVLVAFAALAGADKGLAAETGRSPAQIAAHRQQMLDDMLTQEFQPALIANLRESCALGGEPARVAESRAGGAYFTPDAADGCVTALVRTARDGHLPELYHQLLIKLGGSVEGYERWPRVIGAAVLNGNIKVAIGNNKAAEVKPSMAFDAGFTVAYQDGTASKSGSADARQLKTLAEACLAQHQDAGTCFSAGYMYGSQAFRARNASAR
jgi:hypothetical protein